MRAAGAILHLAERRQLAGLIKGVEVRQDGEKTKRKTTTRSFSTDEIESVITGAPARADAWRAGGLEGLTNVKRARLVQSRRERARLELKHGKGHATVADADRRMAAEHRLLVGARMERDRVKTPAVERSKTQWLIHGYVRNQDGRNVTDATVALHPDADGRKTSVAETTTDSSGYYCIKYAPPTGATVGTAGGRDTTATFETVDVTARRDIRSTVGFRAQVRDRFEREAVYVGARPKGGLLTMDPNPMHPVPGMVAYRDIVVDDPDRGGPGCNLKTQLLGNSNSRELHDLDNEKPSCHVAAIRPDHRVYFTSEQQARKLGYDFCAHCFGRARSER